MAYYKWLLVINMVKGIALCLVLKKYIKNGIQNSFPTLS